MGLKKKIDKDNKKKENDIIASIYRHPHKNDSFSLDYMTKILTKLKNESKNIFTTGDFNLNLL